MNKYLVVFQFPNGLIINRILNAEKLTEEVIKGWKFKSLDFAYRATILNIIKLDE